MVLKSILNLVRSGATALTCERGLRDYMICTECHTVFTENEIEIGELFNCSPDTSVVCSEACEIATRERVKNGTCMNFREYSEYV